jgi:glyoxylate reductase
MSRKILVTGESVGSEFLQPLVDAGYEVKNPPGVLSEDELANELADSVGYLLGGDEVATAKALRNAKDLRVVAFLGVGYESFVDAEAASTLGIPVTNTPGTLIDSVAEFTIGHLLNARRRLTQYANAYRRGDRGIEEKQRDLAGHRIGILGLGAIGTRIAEILTLGFRAPVQYHSRTRKPDEERRLGISFTSLEDLARTSDAIVVMVPGNDSTKGLISSRIVEAMGPDVLLINTARPEIVEPGGLYSGLETGRISVAAFDGFYDDPTGSKLLANFAEDRLLVTGHIASLTHDARDAMARKAVASILNTIESGDDQNVVNRSRG